MPEVSRIQESEMGSHSGHTAVDGVNWGPYPHTSGPPEAWALSFIAFDQVGDGAPDTQGSL